ncbi:MAG: hypothetical protein WKF43_00800, partial [Acidimicrobiales bacterium]
HMPWVLTSFESFDLLYTTRAYRSTTSSTSSEHPPVGRTRRCPRVPGVGAGDGAPVRPAVLVAQELRGWVHPPRAKAVGAGAPPAEVAGGVRAISPRIVNRRRG